MSALVDIMWIIVAIGLAVLAIVQAIDVYQAIMANRRFHREFTQDELMDITKMLYDGIRPIPLRVIANDYGKMSWLDATMACVADRLSERDRAFIMRGLRQNDIRGRVAYMAASFENAMVVPQKASFFPKRGI